MKLLLLTCLVLLFPIFVFSQTSAGNVGELKKLESQISNIEKALAIDEASLAELRIKYSDEYSQIKVIKDRLSDAQKELAKLYLRRKDLLLNSFINDIQISQTELLKIIIIQNERIIELLERVPQSSRR